MPAVHRIVAYGKIQTGIYLVDFDCRMINYTRLYVLFSYSVHNFVDMAKVNVMLSVGANGI